MGPAVDLGRLHRLSHPNPRPLAVDPGGDYRAAYELPGGYTLLGPNFDRGPETALYEAAPGVLTDGHDEYPLVEGIPYLLDASTRPGLEDARVRACAHLRAGDERAALRLLLRDQDRFSPTPPPTEAAVDELIDRRGELTLREAMALLNYGPVADYFAHRWTSPSFQSGLGLLERAALPSRPVLEVACGIGHFLRHLELCGRPAVGLDIVFSKLWLARHFLGVRGPLACADIERSAVFFPGFAEGQAVGPHTVFCHDAFYFFEHKRHALMNMVTASNRGTIAVGHVHTRGDAHEAGFAERLDDYRRYPAAGTPLRDDGAMARTYVSREPQDTDVPPHATAVAWIDGRKLRKPADLRPARQTLRVNPLLRADGTLAYPSAGWREEYEADAALMGPYTLESALGSASAKQLLADGPAAIAALPEAELARLYRHRVLLSLPERW